MCSAHFRKYCTFKFLIVALVLRIYEYFDYNRAVLLYAHLIILHKLLFDLSDLGINVLTILIPIFIKLYKTIFLISTECIIVYLHFLSHCDIYTAYEQVKSAENEFKLK